MKFEVKEWELIDLYKRRNRINFPIYQRGEVWSEEKQRLLVDSILRGIDIPKLYLQYFKGDDDYEEWDCIDGHQRIKAIIGFFDGEFEYQGETFDSLSNDDRDTFEHYKLTIAEVTEIDEEEVRLLFQRLQLGVPLNSGEKLNSILSDMGKFVTKMTEHPFLKNVSIPTRRFAKEQVCAQICNNSAFINKTKFFRNSKYEDLENLYRAYKDFSLESVEAKQIMSVLDRLDTIFSYKAGEITNRASVVSIYLMVEEMILKGSIDGKEGAIKDFYLKFLDRLREEARAGIDATDRFLLAYHSRVIQAADSKTSIAERHDRLKEAFQQYLKSGEII
ncbi:MAG: DUF262 domain-containing protein [Dehalococcoidia bacterium]|nr:DUF262 domain-containing protein [Dehalococcoidia bacterium]